MKKTIPTKLVGHGWSKKKKKAKVDDFVSQLEGSNSEKNGHKVIVVFNCKVKNIKIKKTYNHGSK